MSKCGERVVTISLSLQEKVQTESECQTICHNTEQCGFYTWFDLTNKVFHHYCFLWSSCDSVSCNCVGCTTGPPTCTPQIAEIVPSPPPAPNIVTVENLSVPTSLQPLTDNEILEPSSDLASGTSNIQITGDTSHNLILNISDFSPIGISDQSMISNFINDVNLNTTNTTNNSQGLKSTILNYFPSLKWLFVFID